MKTFDQTLKEIYFQKMQTLLAERKRLAAILARAMNNDGCLVSEDYVQLLNQTTDAEPAALDTVDLSAALTNNQYA